MCVFHGGEKEHKRGLGRTAMKEGRKDLQYRGQLTETNRELLPCFNSSVGGVVAKGEEQTQSGTKKKVHRHSLGGVWGCNANEHCYFLINFQLHSTK